jgi:UDP:flavonoid glycosyltransferase YjiC (YdhE family)
VALPVAPTSRRTPHFSCGRAGLLVAPEDYAVGSISAAVTQVTSDPAFRAAAGRVRDEIAAMPDADAAWAALTF